MAINRRLGRFKFWTDLFVKLVVVAVVGAVGHRFYERHHQPVRIGLIMPLSGTAETAGAELHDAYRLAVESINATGGVLGRPLEVIILDSGISQKRTLAEVERLNREEQVAAFFGCYLSGCRRAILPAIRRLENLLVYPADNEGLEFEPNVFYTGSPPNQLVMPATEWARRNLGRRLFVVGMDDIYPRIAAALIERELKELDGELAGAFFVAPGSEDLATATQAILKARPDAILSFTNGSSLPGLVNALRAAGVNSDQIPIVHVWADEDQLRELGPAQNEGDYLAASYFNDLESKANVTFRAAIQSRYGRQRRFGEIEESAYIGVMMWAAAVTRANSLTPAAVGRALRGLHFEAPSGYVHMDRSNHRLWRQIRVGRFEDTGRVIPVWESEGALAPLNYPLSGTQEEWDELLTALNRKWHGRWAAPEAAL